MAVAPLEIGKIKVLLGENGGRFPFCNSLFIDDTIKVLVDPGAGPETLQELKKQYPVDLVLNTHYHFDHIAYNYLFDQAKIYLNEREGRCFKDRWEIGERLGMADYYGPGWVKEWITRISRPDTVQSPYSPQNRHEWWLSTARLDGTYSWGEMLDFGTTRLQVVGAPGHTAGFSCFYFPAEGVVYTGDIDLTAFGPWYGGKDSNIEDYIVSAVKIASLEADTFVTGHEAGVLSRAEFSSRLEKFLLKIEFRDQKLLKALTYPLEFNEITELGLFYGKPFLVDDWVRAWEANKVRKHLERLMNKNLIKLTNGRYERS